MRDWSLKGEPKEKGGYVPCKFCIGGKSPFPKKQFPGGQPINPDLRLLQAPAH